MVKACVGPSTLFGYFADGHRRLSDLSAAIIDKVDVYNPTEREGFFTYKLNTHIYMGLNTCDFF